MRDTVKGDSYFRETLQALHQMYAKEMKERDFAQQILEITYSSWLSMRNAKKRATILKSKQIKLEPSRIGEIKNELIEKGYAGRLIHYEELKELHQTYAREIITGKKLKLKLILILVLVIELNELFL